MFEAVEAVDDALLGARKAGPTLAPPLMASGGQHAEPAKAEQDLARRDGLLDELRPLAKAHPEDAAVREQLARGLYNTLNHAKDEQDLARRDGLLDELRALANAHPEDVALREQLAMGLYNTLIMPSTSRTWRAGTGCSTSCGRWRARTPRTPRCASGWQRAFTTR